MKQTDIKRLEKVVEHYRKIEELLDKAYESIDKGNTEYLEYADRARTRVTTTWLVKDLYLDALRDRKWIETRIKHIKEQLK